jgi:hypothetical protein
MENQIEIEGRKEGRKESGSKIEIENKDWN